jgi:ubiquinone/menaquinone biosynthesis C-methylase UbiE
VAWGIYNFYNWLQPGFRRKRTQLFLRTFQPHAQTRILDVGGYVWNWWRVVPIDSQIVLLNLNQPQLGRDVPDRYRVLIGDGRQMSFPDREFDIAYSNSVIEHLRTWEDQQRFAAEMRRVGRGYFVQTPNRWFPIEPHFVTLFIHFLPRALCRKLIRPLSYRGWVRSGDNIDLRQLADELRLLSKREMRLLFPDAELHRESWFGLTKSWIAIRKSG